MAKWYDKVKVHYNGRMVLFSIPHKGEVIDIMMLNSYKARALAVVIEGLIYEADRANRQGEASETEEVDPRPSPDA